MKRTPPTQSVIRYARIRTTRVEKCPKCHRVARRIEDTGLDGCGRCGTLFSAGTATDEFASHPTPHGEKR